MTASPQDRLVAELARYLELQHALLTAFEAQGDARSGLVRVPGEWRYTRHGGGVRFVETGTNVVVDVHENVRDATVLDAWRLSAYFGSLGRTGTKLLERVTGRVGVNAVDLASLALAQLVGAGLLRTDGRAFRFPKDADDRAITISFGQLRQDGPSLDDPHERMLRIGADLRVRVGDRTLYAEVDLPVVELASQLAQWLRREPRTDFSYDSEESDVLGLLWVRHAPVGWQVGSALEEYREERVWEMMELEPVLRGFVEAVRREVRSQLGVDVSDLVDVDQWMIDERR